MQCARRRSSSRLWRGHERVGSTTQRCSTASDGILISHLHSDHIAGLFDFLLHTLISERKRPLTIVSPPGLSPILQAMNDAGAMVKNPAELYDFRLIEGLQPEVTIGPWRARGVPLNHTVYNLGYLLTKDDVTLFYTGDTRQPSVPNGLRADFVIHESTYADRNAQLAHDFGHSTATQAARWANLMGARVLFLTHIGSRRVPKPRFSRRSELVSPTQRLRRTAANTIFELSPACRMCR